MSDKELYRRAHAALLDILPGLKGEKITREQLWRIMGINPTNPAHTPFKKALGEVLWNMTVQNKKQGLLQRNGHGFKVVDDDLVPINFKGARGEPFDIVLPFGIHQYCKIYRKNIMIVYGSKDSGKTAFLLNIIRLNMNKHRTLYFSSEMVEDELANRLREYKGLELEDWNFEAYDRSHDFHEAIDPDGLNIIDYLELGGQ